MSDLSLQFGIRVLAEASRLQSGEATRFLFDHYRCANADARDGFVLALIGAVLTSRAVRAAGTSSTRPAAPGASS